MDNQIFTDKTYLRVCMKDVRANILHREEQNTGITANAIKFLHSFDNIFIYNSFGTEAGSSAIVQGLLQRGANVYMPVVSGGQMHAVKVDSGTKFAPGDFGIGQPLGAPIDKSIIDVCVCPGLAFSKSGARLGYGKGYYDKFLYGTDMVRVGICFTEQLLISVPAGVYDIGMDYIITPDGVISTKGQK